MHEDHVVILSIDERQFALPISVVDRVVRAVEVAPLVGSAPVVLGVVNVQGQVMPVVSLRMRCGGTERPIELTDQLVLAHTAQRSVAVLVDSVEVLACPASILVSSDRVMSDTDRICAVIKRGEDLVMVLDPEWLLSTDDNQPLDSLLAQA
jgi:purine-binding chemotaxis protein CheW